MKSVVQPPVRCGLHQDGQAPRLRGKCGGASGGAAEVDAAAAQEGPMDLHSWVPQRSVPFSPPFLVGRFGSPTKIDEKGEKQKG